ncbi:MAG TPA: J domain-containing protein [Leucothrix mucor]|uniref:J domain-containing protein n=1 Tax=Leucothrix mucor TaxID=45248 RepID=A0A7V2WU58_LEUMU|nr:J domain-containing protein [Leucothrix mucor]
MDYKDYYKTLDVKKTASKDEIKKAYRRLARKYHPDVSKAGDAEARFKDVSEAYDVLKDKKKRAQYDQLGSADWNQGQNQQSYAGAEGFGSGGYAQGGNAGFSDFFESIFGQQTQQANPFGEERRTTPASQSATIRLNLEDVFRGAKKTIRLPSGKSIDVKIPKGIEEGKKIRLRGKASTGGDLLLKVTFNKHPDFKVENKDIYLNLLLAPWEAALGATIAVKTLAGSINLKIPAGAYSGQKMRLRGKGLPGSVAGDQYVVLTIHNPPVTDEADQKLYQKMQEHFKWSPRN